MKCDLVTLFFSVAKLSPTDAGVAFSPLISRDDDEEDDDDDDDDDEERNDAERSEQYQARDIQEEEGFDNFMSAYIPLLSKLF